MKNEELLKELREELRKMREELRASRSVQQVVYVPQPVYVPSYPSPYPWWGNGTVIYNNPQPTSPTVTWSTAEIKDNGTTVSYRLASGAPQA